MIPELWTNMQIYFLLHQLVSDGSVCGCQEQIKNNWQNSTNTKHLQCLDSYHSVYLKTTFITFSPTEKSTKITHIIINVEWMSCQYITNIWHIIVVMLPENEWPDCETHLFVWRHRRCTQPLEMPLNLFNIMHPPNHNHPHPHTPTAHSFLSLFDYHCEDIWSLWWRINLYTHKHTHIFVPLY